MRDFFLRLYHKVLYITGHQLHIPYYGLRWKVARHKCKVQPGKSTEQQREEIAGTEINTRSDVTCYNCQRPGHIHLLCPNGENIQKFQVTLNKQEVLFPISWVLLDSGSTVISICNSDLVDNIQYENTTTTVHTNGGSKDYTKTASLHLLPLDVHFNSTSIANILSL